MGKFKKIMIPPQWREYWTAYPHGYTILEALVDWLSEFNEIVENVNDWNEYLDDFVKNFEFELQEEVQSTIRKWQETGLLDDIINNALNIRLDDVEETLNNFKVDIEERLSNLKVNVKDFGAIGDGSVDDSQAIQNAIDSLAEGGTVFIPKGRYRLDKGLIIKNSNIILEGEAGTILEISEDMKVSPQDSDWAIKVYSEDVGEYQQMLSNGLKTGFIASKGDVEVGVVDISKFNVGDLVNIKGDFSTSPWTTDNRGYLTKGETNIVVDVDLTTKKIRLGKPLSDDWVTGEIVNIRPVKPIKNVVIRGLTIKAINNNPTERFYRGIYLENGFMCSVENCHIENCGVMTIVSAYGFSNLFSDNVIVNAWVGDIKKSQLAYALGYALRCESETASIISRNRVYHARHSVDISGLYPSRNILVTENVAVQPAHGNHVFFTHGTAEGCSFTNNIAIGGGFGFGGGGENIVYDGNISTTNWHLLGRNYTITNNVINGYIRFSMYTTSEPQNYIIIKNNVLKSGHITHFTEGEKPYSEVYNFVIEGNTLLHDEPHEFAPTCYAVRATDSGSPKLTFKGLVFRNNYGKNYENKLGNVVFSSSPGYVEFDNDSYIFTDSVVVDNPPLHPTIGQMAFLKGTNKPIWYDGEKWIYADGTSV